MEFDKTWTPKLDDVQGDITFLHAYVQDGVGQDESIKPTLPWCWSFAPWRLRRGQQEIFSVSHEWRGPRHDMTAVITPCSAQQGGRGEATQI
jgi:hypothetical protein